MCYFIVVMSIYDEYFNYTTEYMQKYGNNTIVLLQVGAFFEIYGIKNQSTGEITDDSLIVEMADVCQLNISEKKVSYNGASAVGNCTIVMAGFRDFTIDKYLQKLTDAGYTVPVFIQVKDSSKNIKRQLDCVYSSGTYISYETEESNKISNNIMCIWIEKFKPFGRKSSRDSIVCGLSVINIFTGKTNIFQYETTFYMNTTTFDELEKYVSIYCPCEIIIISPFSNNDINNIIQYSGINCRSVHNILSTEDDPKIKNCTSQKYIKHILSSFFGDDSYDICSEFQENNIATQSFCYLLNFIKEQNPNLIKKISIPDCNNTTSRMVLANHTLSQLNVINDLNYDTNKSGKFSSVLSLINKCCSPMGKRRFQYQLTNPTFNEEWLDNEYKMTDVLLKINETNENHIDFIRKQLIKIRDIEKLSRQIIIRKIYPSSIYHLYNSIAITQQLNICFYENLDLCDYLVSDF